MASLGVLILAHGLGIGRGSTSAKQLAKLQLPAEVGAASAG